MFVSTQTIWELLVFCNLGQLKPSSRYTYCAVSHCTVLYLSSLIPQYIYQAAKIQQLMLFHTMIGQLFLLLSHRHHTSHHSSGYSKSPRMQQTNMGLSKLDHTVQSLINRGLSTATQATYESGKRKYQSFCRQFHLAPLPVSESSMSVRVILVFIPSHIYYN